LAGTLQRRFYIFFTYNKQGPCSANTGLTIISSALPVGYVLQPYATRAARLIILRTALAVAGVKSGSLGARFVQSPVTTIGCICKLEGAETARKAECASAYLFLLLRSEAYAHPV
jgi:hypothetical protein